MAFGNRLNVVFSKLLQSLSTISRAILLKLRKKPKKLKLPKLPTRWVVCYLIVLVPVIRAVRLYETNPDQFWLEIPFLVSSIAAIFAGISIWLAFRSLKMTEKALELTRITVRPFLALQPGDVSSKQSQQLMILEFHVKNTGPVPANLVTIEIAFFDDSEVIEEDNGSKYYRAKHEQPEGVVIFPGAVYNVEQAINLSPSSGKNLVNNMANGKVNLRFRVTYRAQGTEYVTVQTERLGKAMAGVITRFPIQPQRWT